MAAHVKQVRARGSHWGQSYGAEATRALRPSTSESCSKVRLLDEDEASDAAADDPPFLLLPLVNNELETILLRKDFFFSSSRTLRSPAMVEDAARRTFR